MRDYPEIVSKAAERFAQRMVSYFHWEGGQSTADHTIANAAKSIALRAFTDAERDWSANASPYGAPVRSKCATFEEFANHRMNYFTDESIKPGGELDLLFRDVMDAANEYAASNRYELEREDPCIPDHWRWRPGDSCGEDLIPGACPPHEGY